jgi:ketosteroid isomerase-like protein
MSAPVVERYLAALASGDWPGLAACLDADVERIGPYGDVYRGREPYTAFLRETVSALAGYALHVERLIVTVSTVVAELHETVDTPAGRRTHEAVVFDVAGDRIRRVAVYLRKATVVSEQRS